MTFNSTPKSFEIKGGDRKLNPRLPEFSDIGTSNFVKQIIEEGGERIGQSDTLKNVATELDVFSMSGFSNTQFKSLILSKTGVDISTTEGRYKIYETYTQALDFFTNVLFRTSSNEVSGYKMKNESEIYSFLNGTHNSGTRRQTYCSIVKIMFLLLEQNGSDELQLLDEKAEVAIQELFTPHIIYETPGFPVSTKETYATIIYDCGDGIDKIIRFKLKFRAKNDISNVLKLGYNPEYYSSELLMDAIGLEYEVEDATDLLYIQAYFYSNIFKSKGRKTSISNKNILELVKDLREGIDDDFYSMLDSDDLDEERKAQTSISYRDLKTTVYLPVPKNPKNRNSPNVSAGFEIRGVLSGNKNNSGLADHRIYNYFKRIEFLIRMQGYVTEAYVKLVINKLFEENPDAKFSKDKILRHYLRALFKIHIGRKQQPFYTTSGRFKTLSQRSDLYPEGIRAG